MRATLCGLLLICLSFVLSPLHAASDVPPVGPTWQRDLVEAQKLALERKQPIFIYFTKTYCPHCVVVERELLTNAGLKPAYDKMVWVYVYNNFSHDELDRCADRIRHRFSISSWPHLLFVDPMNMEVVGYGQRTLEPFLKDMESAIGKLSAVANAAKVNAKFRATDELAKKLQAEPTKELALERLAEDDVVVRMLAVEYLVKEAPELVAQKAEKLLTITNDTLRYKVCEAMIAAKEKVKPSSAVYAILHDWFEPSVVSMNPNVLRTNAAKLLGEIGEKASFDVLVKALETRAVLGGAESTTFFALGNIAGRVQSCRKPAVELLLKALPPVPPGNDPKEQRVAGYRAKQLVEALNKATESTYAWPGKYDDAIRKGIVDFFNDAMNGKKPKPAPESPPAKSDKQS